MLLSTKKGKKAHANMVDSYMKFMFLFFFRLLVWLGNDPHEVSLNIIITLEDNEIAGQLKQCGVHELSFSIRGC